VEKQITRRGADEISSRRKALDITFTQIEKTFGKDAIMRLGQQPSRDHDAISTGSLLVDHAIGIGGIPRGRITEIYGPEASGKTTLALQAIATAQSQGLTAVFIDAEHALDTTYAQRLGINVDDLIVSQPDYGEQALEIAEMLIRSNAVDIIVIDSVAALVPKAEVDGEMGDTHIGLQARLMSQALRKLTPVVHRSKTALIFINQIRQNINAMAFANKEVTSGGNALKFYASLRIDVRKIQSIKDKSGDVRGNKVLVKMAKNKMAPPFKKVEVDLIFGEGISRDHEVFNIAVAHDIIHQSGAWFSFSGEKLGQGKDHVLLIFKERPELFAHITSLVKSALDALVIEKQRLIPVLSTSSDNQTAIGGEHE
jgi:recombination protein RecA